MADTTSSVQKSQALPQMGAGLDAFLALPRPFPSRVSPAPSPYLEPHAKIPKTPAEWNDWDEPLFATRMASGLLERDCPGVYLQAVCPDCGTRFIKRIYCAMEWCPVCGAEWSNTHKRRFARWWEKIAQIASVGYFVFTVPMQIRRRYRTKPELRILRAGVVEILKGHGYDRGLSRFHWFGDTDSQKYNPHLNVLVDGVFLSPKILATIKNEYRALLGLADGDPIDVNYRYSDEIGQIIHMAKYITRATFRDISTEELEDLAWDLKGFMNTHNWGGAKRWEGEAVQILKEQDLPEAEELLMLIALEKSLCPLCGGALRWEMARGGVADLQNQDLEELGGGYAIARMRPWPRAPAPATSEESAAFLAASRQFLQAAG